MTSTTPDPAHAAAAPPAYQLPQRVTQARVLRSEWTKLRTVPDTSWLLLGTIALTIAVSAAAAAATKCHSAGCNLDPAKISLGGIQLGQTLIAILAVVAIAGEYSTGTIGVSLAAVRVMPDMK